jgi:hypothetical protein
LQVTIIHKEGIVGFIGVHYLVENYDEIDACWICQKVQEISYFLNKD